MTHVYVTFGQSHAHSIGGVTFDKDCIAAIPCTSYGRGRTKAFEYFGPKFCWCYSEEEFRAKEEQLLSFFPRGIISIPPQESA